jgi:hypothetical protein
MVGGAPHPHGVRLVRSIKGSRMASYPRVPVILNHFSRVTAGLIRQSTSCPLRRRKKDVDAREDGVPAA